MSQESPFFAYLSRLQHIQRWSLMRNIVTENVATHSFYVALITHALCVIARDVHGKQLDVERAVLLALFDDVGEVFTGDVATPVKHHNAKILSGFRELEALAVRQLLDCAPPTLSAEYASLLQPKEADAELRAYVKAADTLSGYIKCASEVASGNQEFASAREQLRRALDGLNMPEVHYFLDTFGSAFEKTLDQLVLTTDVR